MRYLLIENMKQEIEFRLNEFLKDEDIRLQMAANDNMARYGPLFELETIDDRVLEGKRLLFEIKVVLGLLEFTWQSETLMEGIYHTLHPHNITLSELAILLMSMHVEPVMADKKETSRKRAVMRYIVEEC